MQVFYEVVRETKDFILIRLLSHDLMNIDLAQHFISCGMRYSCAWQDNRLNVLFEKTEKFTRLEF